MKQTVLALLIACVLVIGTANAQKKSKLIAKGAEIEKAGDGYRFTEGPAVAPDGKVYFTDQPNDRIHVWDENSGVSLWLEGTGRSNGMYFNEKGQLVTCADEKNQLAYFDENKKLQVIHEGYDDKHLNAPNDLWIDPAGGVAEPDLLTRLERYDPNSGPNAIVVRRVSVSALNLATVRTKPGASAPRRMSG